MPRQQRELDPGGGPLTELARDLRDLRARAGDPKFATMARRTGRSKTALAEAAGGRRLPRWETVEDFVRACDGDPTPWHDRWLAVRAQLGGRPATVNPDLPGTAEDPADAGPPADLGPQPDAGPQAAAPPPVDARAGAGRPGRRVLLVAAVLGVLALAAAAGGGYAVGQSSAPAPFPWAQLQLRAIEVQNMVALGADRLVEDRTPAYLSTLPISFCAQPSRQCKVEGTEVVSGAALVAHCTTRGQRMHNYNIEEQDALSTPNPHRVSSDLWYRAAFPDGRVGVISEVYLKEYSRGGLGLPDCGDAVGTGGG